jgi:hypothetical protein
MSEFQYFEFKAIERALTKDEQATLRSFSTRATIGSRSFTNEYHWGDFKGDTVGWMKRYFDAHVYLSNFGSRALHLRIPLALVDRESFRPYEVEHVVEIREAPEHVVISIYSDQDEGRDYDEHDEDPSQVLDNLLPLRDEIARGDLRALYLAWLVAAWNRSVDEEESEPPVPPGLGERGAALESLVSFLWLDPELVEVAALRSPPARVTKESKVTADAWLARLSGAEKHQWLRRFLADEQGHATMEFQRRFQAAVQQDLRSTRELDAPDESAWRRAGELLKAAEDLSEANEQAAKLRKAEERAAAEKKAAEERLRFLQTLPGQEENLWKSVIALTATSTPANYDSAVRQIIDLRDLYKLTGDRNGFSLRLAELRDLRAKKSSLIARLDRAGLKSMHW